MCHASHPRRKYLSAKSLLHFQAGYFTAETSLGTVGRVSATPAPGAPSAPAGVRSVVLRSGVYADSVKLMQVSRDVGARDGVTAVLVAMATPLNLELAADMGLAPDERRLARAAAHRDPRRRRRGAGRRGRRRRRRAAPRASARPAPPPPSRSARSAPASTTCRPTPRRWRSSRVPGQLRRRRGRRRDRRRPQRPRLLRRRPGRARGGAQARRARRRRARHGPRLRDGDRLRRRPRLRQRRPARVRWASSRRRGTGAQQVSCLLDMAGVGRLARAGRRRAGPVRGRRRAGHPRRARRAGRRPGHRAGAAGVQAAGAVGGRRGLQAAAAELSVPVRSAALSPETPDLTAAVEALLTDMGLDVPTWPSRPGPAEVRASRRGAQGPLLRGHARRRGDAARRARPSATSAPTPR